MAEKTYLSWPFLEDRHRELAGAIETWAGQHIDSAPHGDIDVDAACREAVRKLAAGGFLHYAVALRQAGEKLDVRSMCLLRETLARHAGLADFAFAMQCLGSVAISLFGDDDLQQEYLTGVRNGDKIAAFALTEPEAGSDVAAMTTRAEADGEDYILNGEKTYISNGGIADFYTVFARTGGPGAKGISAFILDADTPGLEIAERIEVMAPHPLARLTFNNCRVPKHKMLGESGQGFKVSMASLDVCRSTVGAAALGFARRALDEALQRTATRKLFGAPMAEIPGVQTQLAEMALNIDTSALLVYRAAWTRDRVAERVTREAAMAKLHATDSAQLTIDAAVQLFGGMGVTCGVKVEELYREIRALRIYEGASEVQKLIIGRQTLLSADITG
ncbi:acyl-CoA dehydrogenase [Exilibacterium tricleocarpae]|uniref:Acyl-CoA dehydrogenase n=1 Tax=Exilibacterium tricleocarpae TaxID=2591008 RepID=A0A545TVF5_9GAMM|nr:acyl-CoA dehydrogenase family protein [Exilibacterium tricleocarpae]TQV81196.1 acyl-CoA dehydrogenase [Exilibacterium tricleocarpae]